MKDPALNTHAIIPLGSADLYTRPAHFEAIYGKGFLFTVGASCLELARIPSMQSARNAAIVPVVGDPWFVLSPAHVAVNTVAPNSLPLPPHQIAARQNFLHQRRGNEEIFPDVMTIRMAQHRPAAAPHFNGALLSILSSNVFLLTNNTAKLGPDLHRDPRRDPHQGEWLRVAAIITGNGNPTKELLSTLTPIDRHLAPSALDPSPVTLPLLYLRDQGGLSFDEAERLALKKSHNHPLVSNIRRIEHVWHLPSKALAIDCSHPREFGLVYDRLRVYSGRNTLLQDSDKECKVAKTIVYDSSQNTLSQFIVAVWRLPPNHAIHFLGTDSRSYREPTQISDPSTPSSALRLLEFMMAYGAIEDPVLPKRRPPVSSSKPGVRLVA